tara:strand:- start:1216 stop:1401 length:186 start_codon:yes stop_codon:yes gene_type:complete
MRRDFKNIAVKKLNAEKHNNGRLTHKEASIALKSKRNYSKMIIKNKKNNKKKHEQCCRTGD